MNPSAIPLSGNIFLNFKLRSSHDEREKSYSAILYNQAASNKKILVLFKASSNSGGFIIGAVGFGVFYACAWSSLSETTSKVEIPNIHWNES